MILSSLTATQQPYGDYGTLKYYLKHKTIFGESRKKDKYFFRRPFQDQALAVYCNAYVSLQFMVDFETKRAHGGLLYSIVDLFFIQAYKADQVAF